MNRIYLYIGVLPLLLGALACEEAVEWEFQPNDNNQLVVESIITNELKFQEVKL